MIKQLKSSGSLFLLLVCALSLAGCSSWNKPASASFASVTIARRTAEQILDATSSVFHENGYAGPSADVRYWIFTREGSRLETISRDGLIAAQDGQSTFVRVKVELVEQGSGVYRLQCQAYMVTDAGQHLEDEVRLLNIRSRPYQNLLNEIRKRLK